MADRGSHRPPCLWGLGGRGVGGWGGARDPELTRYCRCGLFPLDAQSRRITLGSWPPPLSRTLIFDS